MSRFALLGILPSVYALLVAAPAIAQEPDADAWSLSGGFDLIELRHGEGDDAFLWDGTFTLGNATDQLMLATQGGGALGNQIDQMQVRLFYGRAIGNATLLLGVREDFKPHPRDIHAAIGAQGTIGTRLGWESYVFLSDNGRLTGEGQLVYQLPITGRLYLEPRITAAWSAQNVQPDDVRSGLTEGQASLRLRYRLTTRLNIYTAIVHERLLGDTRRLAHEQRDTAQSTMAVIGFGFSL